MAMSFPHLTDKERTRLAHFYDLKATSVARLLEKGGAEGRLSHADSGTAGAVGIIVTENAEFDSKHYALPISKFRICYSSELLDIAAMSDLIAATSDRLKSMGQSCVFARVNLDDSTSLAALEASGFNEMDILQTLAIDVRRKSEESAPKGGETTIRSFRNSEIEAVTRVAAETYTPSRYFRDARFREDKVREYYAKWAANCCEGLADDVIVAERIGKLVGFITVKMISDPDSSLHPEGGVIDLVRVHPSFQRQGIGTSLTRAAIFWFRSRNAQIVTIGTEANNVAAMNCYLNEGFRLRSCMATFHRWL